MALGYCKVCDKLVTIRLTPSVFDGPDARALTEVRRGEVRHTVWVPIQHDGLDGEPCPGIKKPV